MGITMTFPGESTSIARRSRPFREKLLQKARVAGVEDIISLTPSAIEGISDRLELLEKLSLDNNRAGRRSEFVEGWLCIKMSQVPRHLGRAF